VNESINPDLGTIHIIANGQLRIVKVDSTIADFLQQVNIEPAYVVAQLNGAIVSRSAFDKTILEAGCKLEIVTMVGGG